MTAIHVQYHCSHTRKGMESTQIFINRQMDENIVHTHNGILLSHKKEITKNFRKRDIESIIFICGLCHYWGTVCHMTQKIVTGQPSGVCSLPSTLCVFWDWTQAIEPVQQKPLPVEPTHGLETIIQREVTRAQKDKYHKFCFIFNS